MICRQRWERAASCSDPESGQEIAPKSKERGQGAPATAGGSRRYLKPHCSPAEALLPHRALLPHKAFEPHNALLPQSALLPHRAFDPHRALLPHRALIPHNALVPVVVVEGAPETNSDDPHTAEFDQVAEVFQTDVVSALR